MSTVIDSNDYVEFSPCLLRRRSAGTIRAKVYEQMERSMELAGELILTSIARCLLPSGNRMVLGVLLQSFLGYATPVVARAGGGGRPIKVMASRGREVVVAQALRSD